MSNSGSNRIASVLALMIGIGSLSWFYVTPAGAAVNPCKASCSAERSACKGAAKSAFQSDKEKCTGTGKAKRQCVKAARNALRSAQGACRGFSSDCRDCCKDGGTSCDVRCGDGVVS